MHLRLIETNENKRKYAAYLARQFYSGKKPVRLIEDEYPYEETDKDFNRLLHIIMQTPKRKGLFKVSADKYEKYFIEVYKLIEKFEG